MSETFPGWVRHFLNEQGTDLMSTINRSPFGIAYHANPVLSTPYVSSANKAWFGINLGSVLREQSAEIGCRIAEDIFM